MMQTSDLIDKHAPLFVDDALAVDGAMEVVLSHPARRFEFR